MPGSKRFLHPEAIKRISRLEIRARHVVEGFLAGMHRSPYFGQSIEFLQHREYVTGDDLRHVDWKVWARQDRLYIKQFEEETSLRAYLLVDASSSMGWSSDPREIPAKSWYARQLAACLALLLLRQGDAVGLVGFDQGLREHILPRGGRRHWRELLRGVTTLEPRGTTEAASAMRVACAARVRFRRFSTATAKRMCP